MSLTRANLREKLGSGNRSGEPSEVEIDALEGSVGREENVLYRLPGKGGLVREYDGGTEKTEPPAGGLSLAVVTDGRLLFVVAGQTEETVIEIGYTDIRRVDAHDGLLRSKLRVAVWGDGEYRLKIADSSELGAAVKYLREAGEIWDRVVATLEDVYDRIGEVGDHLEVGELEAARNHRQRANEKLERARTYLDRAEIDAPAVLLERIEAAEQELYRTEIRTRIARAGTMITEGTHQTEAREYTDAYRNFWYARDHLETALSVARKAQLPEPPEISSKLDAIETRLTHLEVKPRALAEQACERAVGTDSLRTEIEAWQEAFGHYRDALTAGWGTDLEFSGETEELRFKSEIAVGKLIEARCQLATRLETKGEGIQDERLKEALDHYEEAIEQLKMAHQLASEFRSGDADSIEAQLNSLRGKRYRATQQ